VSAEKVADLVSVDAIYKFAGGDYDTENKLSGNTQPSGDGSWGHAFGLYANLHLLDTLGIGLGYSGFTSVQEKFRSPSDTEYTYRFPYYNGINLHVNFSGVDKLSISFINNVSFSTMRGTDDEKTVTVGLNGSASPYITTWTAAGMGSSGMPLSDSDISEGYLALSNALGAKYNITDQLAASFQIANRLFSYTETGKVNIARERGNEVVLKSGANDFRAGLGAEYALGNVTLGTGLLFDLLTHSQSLTANNGLNNTGNETWDWGTFTFGIPIQFKVTLP
jgi:hypothetical protein